MLDCSDEASPSSPLSPSVRSGLVELPRDLWLHIAKLVVCDMDTRISLGIVGKLSVPESLRLSLSNIVPPAELGKNVYGVKIYRHVIFRGIVDSKMYANSCECHEFVTETRGLERTMRVTREDGRVHEVSPILTDFWSYCTVVV